MIPQKFYIFIHIFLIYLLLTALGIETYVFHKLNLELNKVIDKGINENQELSNKLAETEKSWNEKWSKRNWEACGGPFEVCKFIQTGRESFTAVYTSRGKETTYTLVLPENWEITSYAGDGLGVNFSTKDSSGRLPSGVIYAKKQFEEKEGQVNCASNPELEPGISPKLKQLFEKYKNVRTNFGTLKLSRIQGNDNTNKYNLCQAKQDGYPDWITDTLIGHISLEAEEEDFTELERVIRSVTAAKILRTIFQ